MYEFSVAKSYLWPKKKRLSFSLIGLMSLFVISLVIWLVLLFLSVTEGIEKNWLKKLTSLNAPIRIIPTEEYYNSYYYQIDGVSSASHYTLKTIGEKLHSPLSDPYQPEVDEELPFYFPLQEKTPDLVKDVFASLSEVKGVAFQEYEVAGAVMQLKLLRKGQQNFLSQASYIANFTEESKDLISLLLPPTLEDIQHLLSTPHSFPATMKNLEVDGVSTIASAWCMPSELLPENEPFTAYLHSKNEMLLYVMIPTSKQAIASLTKGVLVRKKEGLSFTHDGQTKILEEVPLYLDGVLHFQAGVKRGKASNLSEVQLDVRGELQNKPLNGTLLWKDLKLEKFRVIDHFEKAPSEPPPWVYYVDNTPHLQENGVILPIQFRENHVLIGDKGHLSYSGSTAVAIQEQRVAVQTVGFYDPGVMSIGARLVLAPSHIVRTINASCQNVSLDPLLTNGIMVWFPSLKKTPLIALEIQNCLQKHGIAPYWKVVPFYQYEFAKDLMSQFQSDRYLFMLVGVIILLVACSNIISLLLLLVNDKKHEIGVLISLGASKKSIAAIFGICGVALGMVSCLIGTFFAYFTLSHIDHLVYLLNALEGRAAFNTAFYGQSLPKELSQTAFAFVLIITPILSLIAGLIPAIKACKLKPSAILRSE